MQVQGKVRGLSNYYAESGLERLEIWIAKHKTGGLPYEEGHRISITLMIKGQSYEAGIRATRNTPYVWICADLDKGTTRLAQVLDDAGFVKNQSVVLDVEDDTTIRLFPA